MLFVHMLTLIRDTFLSNLERQTPVYQLRLKHSSDYSCLHFCKSTNIFNFHTHREIYWPLFNIFTSWSWGIVYTDLFKHNDNTSTFYYGSLDVAYHNNYVHRSRVNISHNLKFVWTHTQIVTLYKGKRYKCAPFSLMWEVFARIQSGNKAISVKFDSLYLLFGWKPHKWPTIMLQIIGPLVHSDSSKTWLIQML